MKNKNLEKDEVVLLETSCIYKSKENKLIITNKNMIFENPKSIFKKITKVSLSDIKKYKNKSRITIKENKIIIDTIKDDIEIILNNKDTKKVYKVIKDAIGEGKIYTAKDVVSKVAKGTKEVVVLASTAAEIYNDLKNISGNKKSK